MMEVLLWSRRNQPIERSSSLPTPLRLYGPLPSALCFLLAALLAGCGFTGTSVKELQFAEQFPYEDMNHTLVLERIDGVTDTTLGRVITLELENRSSQTISLSTASGVVGLAYDIESESWVEIENTVTYPDFGVLLGPRGGGIPSTTAIYFEPAVADSVDTMDIRILVVGHLWDDDHASDATAAAFIDLTLQKVETGSSE